MTINLLIDRFRSPIGCCLFNRVIATRYVAKSQNCSINCCQNGNINYQKRTSLFIVNKHQLVVSVPIVAIVAIVAMLHLQNVPNVPAALSMLNNIK